MTFILTDRKKLTPTDKDCEYLQDTLEEIADQINYSWWKTAHDQRVFYHAAPSVMDGKTVKIYIGFRKEDLDKHPTKYGLNFRNDCFKTALRFANEILSKDRKFLVITIAENSKQAEECKYERRDVV